MNQPKCSLFLAVLFAIFLSSGTIEAATAPNKQKGDAAIPLGVGSETVVHMNGKNKVSKYCVEEQPPTSILYTLGNYFVQTTITVQSNFPLNWYSVRGKSTDDFYTMIKSTFFRHIFRIDEEEERELMKTRDALEGYGFVRDLFSSCPSPLFGRPEQTKCSMRFSPVGEPCIMLDMEKSLSKGSKAKKPEVVIEVNRGFNRRGFIFLLIGLAFMKLSKELSKSKTVQYIVGAVTFVTVGILIVVLSIVSRLLPDKEPQKGDNRKINIGLALSGVYGVSGIYFLRAYLRSMLMVYWEITLLYVVVMSIAGLTFVYLMRSRSESKNVYRVVGKHLARLTGLFAVYHSSASPLASTITIMGSLLSYVRYKALKKTSKPSKSAKKAS